MKKIVTYCVPLLAGIASFNLYASTPTDDEVQQHLISSLHFNEECYIRLDSESVNLSIPNVCDRYFLIDQSGLNGEERTKKTSSILGLGFMDQFVLVKYPHNRDQKIISLYEKFDGEFIVDEIDSAVLREKKKISYSSPSPRMNKAIGAPSSLMNSYSSPSPLVSSYGSTSSRINRFEPHNTILVRQVIPLNETINYNSGRDKAVFEYEIDFFTKQPFYNEAAQTDLTNRKFVRVSLVGGPGISFNTNNSYNRRGYMTLSPGRDYQKLYYVYRDYLDEVTVSSSLTGNGVHLYDHNPKNTDRNLTKFTKESSVTLDIGLSIPKVPINNVAATSNQSISYESGDFMDFNVTSTGNSYAIKYFNRRYGSEIKREDGYCDLIDDATGCWKRTTGTDVSPFNMRTLRGTPYSNGFIPTYVTTYSAPFGLKKSSSLNLNATIQGVKLLGHARWSGGNTYVHGWKGLEVLNQPEKEFTLHQYRASNRITIDWGSPLFSGAQPVIISSLYGSDTTAQCLTVKNNGNVRREDCRSGDFNQLFYYTPSAQNYVSATNYNKCLSTSASRLIIETCAPNSNNNQTWIWANNSPTFSTLYTANFDGFKLITPSNNNGSISVDSVSSLTNATRKNLFNSRLGHYLNTSITQY